MGSGTKRQDRLRSEKLPGGRQSPVSFAGRRIDRRSEDSGQQIARRRKRRNALQRPKNSAVAEDAAGLLILSPEAKIGTPIRDLFHSNHS